MEDYILRKIDRIGEMLQHIARRLGLLKDNPQDYSLNAVKEAFGKENLPLDLDVILLKDNPVWYLVEKEKPGSRHCLATALTYLDGKGYFSFKLHSLISLWHSSLAVFDGIRNRSG